MTAAYPQCVKIMIVGDENCGKTSLLLVWSNGNFPPNKVSPVIDNYTYQMNIDGKLFDIGVWDTKGSSDYDRLRPLSYPRSNATLLCFDISNKKSYNNVNSKWLPEIQHHMPQVPFVLLGLKNDLRMIEDEMNLIKSSIFVEHSSVVTNYFKQSFKSEKILPNDILKLILKYSINIHPDAIKNKDKYEFVSQLEGKQLAEKIGAYKYMECSAFTKEGIDNILEEAVKSCCDPIPKKNKRCIVM